MGDAKVLTPVLVILDGKEMTATLASPCLVVFMEVVMALHWLANVTMLHYGLEDFVMSPFVLAAKMVTALHLEYVNVTLAGRVPTAQSVLH